MKKRQDAPTLATLAVSGAVLPSCGGGSGGPDGGGTNLPAASTQDIVFVSDCDSQSQFEIYTMKADGSNQTRVTNTPDIEGQPSWRPDKRKIAFDFVTAIGSSDYEVYVMNADGSGRVDLTNNPAIDAEPAYSPDGKKIAFVSNRDGQAEIYVMNEDGSGLRRLTRDATRDDVDPKWIPDGSKIVFAKASSPTSYTTIPPFTLNTVRSTAPRSGGTSINFFADVYTMIASDGSDVRRLTSDGSGATNRHPVWNPNGSLIAFVHNDSNGIPTFNFIDPQGGNRTSTPGWDGFLSFSPDGTRFSYGSSKIFSIRVDGTDSKRLITTQDTQVNADWR